MTDVDSPPIPLMSNIFSKSQFSSEYLNPDDLHDNFILGPPAITKEMPPLYRSACSENLSDSFLVPPWIEKAWAYSHEIPDIERLVCGGCAKDLSSFSGEDLCAWCSKGLLKAKEFASSFGGLAFIGPKCRSIAYACVRGHSWVVALSKATKSWCA